MTIANDGQARYPLTSSGSTQTTATLTAGRFAPSSLASPLLPFATSKRRGVEISFAGSGSNNGTYSYKVWVGQRGKASESTPEIDVTLQLFGSGAVTLGGNTGPSLGGAGGTDGIPVTTSERYADTVTWTLASFGTTVESAYGSTGSRVYSPADDTPARLFIPDLGGADFIVVEFHTLSSVTYAFCLIERKT